MGTLHLVATPIGNLEDLSPRAVAVLREVDLLLAEDTRHTRTLLQHHGIAARPLSLHAHNEAARIGRVLAALEGSGSVALVCDAGTPLVSDPGGRLAAAVAAAGHRVTAVPGASAVLAALSVSGLPCEQFVFLGFLPRKAGARRKRIAAHRDRPETLVLFESPRRVAATLKELDEVLGERAACVARELTKLHEEVVRGTLAELAQRFADGARGEITLVVAGAPDGGARPDVGDLDDAIREALSAGRPVKEIASELSRDSGLPRRDVYARVVALREPSS